MSTTTYPNVTLTVPLGIYYGDIRYIFPKVLAQYAKPFLHLKDRRVIATFNDKIKLHVVLMHDGNGDFFININKATRKKLGVENGDEVQINLVPDESKYGMEVCAELAEFLAQDPVFENYFDHLTTGKRRRLIWLAGKPKSAETRLQKILVMADFLKNNQGKLDLALLNGAFKNNPYR